MLKIDVHTHILPESWPDLRERYGYGGWVNLEHHCPGCAKMLIDGNHFRTIDANCWDPHVRLQDCDATGVHMQVLSTVPVMFGYWAKPADTLDLARLLNDHIAEVCRAQPERFIGLGTLPMQAPDLAVDELHRCINELGLAGIEIGSHINPEGSHWNLDQPELFPVFHAAEQLGAAVFVHPWDMMAKATMPKYWLPWLVGMPAETSLAICSMIFGGVFERLPGLRVCFAHGGGAFPYTVGRVEHGFHVRPDLCAVDNQVNPRAYLGRFWVDSLVHDERALQLLLDVCGEDRVTLGSDYPFPLGEHVPGQLIETMPDLTDVTRAKLLAENAIELFGLSRDQLAIAQEATPWSRSR